MALSRQHIVQMADKLYERGEYPTVINLREEIRERTDEKHVSLVEIAHGLRLWRNQQFDAHDAVNMVSDKTISTAIHQELERSNTALNDRLLKLIHPYLSHVKQSMAGGDDEIVALANLVDQINKKLLHLNEDLAHITSERDALTKTQKDNESELKVLHRQEANQTELLETYKAENTDLKHKYASMSETKETFSQQVNELSAEISHVKNDRTHLQAQLNEQKRIIEKQQKGIEELQTLKHRAELSANKAEQNAADTLARFDEINKAKDRAHHDIDTLKKQLTDLQNIHQEQEKNLAIAKTQADERDAEKVRMATELKDKQVELQEQQATIDQLKTQQHELKAKAENFQTKIMAERSRCEQLEQQIRLLTTHNEEIDKSRLSQASTIKRLEEEINQLKYKFQERQQLWIKEKRNLTDRLENERQQANEMKIEIAKSRHHS